MKLLSGPEAMDNLKRGFSDGSSYVPAKEGFNDQFDGVGFLPNFTPKFKINAKGSFFAIGSCFTRMMEYYLALRTGKLYIDNFDPLCPSFKPDEIGFIPPDSHLLNEYNLGTMLQRVKSAAGKFEYPELSGVWESPTGYRDLFLHTRSVKVSMNELQTRRKIIKEYYENIFNADTIVITVGLTECWYDTKYKVFLNKTPHSSLIKAEPDRYEFHRFTYQEVIVYLIEIIELLNSNGNLDKKILLTVGPGALEATFTGKSCILASAHTKAVLRAAVETVSVNYSNVEYFPSYEVVTSRGCIGGFDIDNTHVSEQAVLAVFKLLDKVYFTE